MEKLIPYIVGPVIMVLPLALIVSVVYLSRRIKRARRRRNPLTRSLLRPPGSGLKKALESTQDQLISIAISLLIASGYVGGFYMGHTTAGAKFGMFFWILAGIFVVLGLAYAIRKIITLQEAVYRQRLGLDGEMAVGEELNHLMRRGYLVFHDVPGLNYNVDHVVIGPNGVFAVETKTHPKSDGAFVAEFDGKVIRYPDWVDVKSTEQASRQAASVSKFLTKACGRLIKVGGVVILPGWNVKQTMPTQGCVVMASGQILNEFPRLKRESLLDDQIKAAGHQIEQLCRSESPMALSDEDDIKFNHRPTL